MWELTVRLLRVLELFTELMNGPSQHRDVTSNDGLPTGSAFPTRDDNGTLADHRVWALYVQRPPSRHCPGLLICGDLTLACWLAMQLRKCMLEDKE